MKVMAFLKNCISSTGKRVGWVAVLLLILSTQLFGVPRTFIPLPADLNGTLLDVPYKIRVPANWNGTLLVYTHGNGIYPEPELVPQVIPESGQDLAQARLAFEESLLSQGYAMAASALKASGSDLKNDYELNLALTAYFKWKVGYPRRTLLWGESLGGAVSNRMIEKFPFFYEGAIVMTEGRNSPSGMDRALDIGLAYAATDMKGPIPIATINGWPVAFGPIGDLTDNINWPTFFFNTQWPYFDPTSGANNIGQWEFIRLVMGLTGYPGQPEGEFWPLDSLTERNLFGGLMWAATMARSMVEAVWGGPVAQNLDRSYSLSTQDIQYLTSYGIPETTIQGWLDSMNGQKIEADPSARRRLVFWGQPSGQLWRPVLRLHTKFDGLCPVAGENAYYQLAKKEGSLRNLVQAYTNGVGHCVYTGTQLHSALDAMSYWLNTGKKPGAVFFPEAQGFDNNFVPPPSQYKP